MGQCLLFLFLTKQIGAITNLWHEKSLPKNPPAYVIERLMLAARYIKRRTRQVFRMFACVCAACMGVFALVVIYGKLNLISFATQIDLYL